MVRLSHIYSIIFILLVYGFSYSDTHYVSLNGTNDAGGGYTTWEGASTQIQWAVDAAANGETVLVSNGTYFCWGIYTNISMITTNSSVSPPTTNWPTTNTAMVVITNSITLKSLSGFYTNTVINGNFPAYTNARGIYIANTGAVLDGFTITNCFTTNQAGA